MKPDNENLRYFKLSTLCKAYYIAALGFKYIEIRTSEFVAKNQFLCKAQKKNIQQINPTSCSKHNVVYIAFITKSILLDLGISMQITSKFLSGLTFKFHEHYL